MYPEKSESNDSHSSRFAVVGMSDKVSCISRRIFGQLYVPSKDWGLAVYRTRRWSSEGTLPARRLQIVLPTQAIQELGR